MSHAAKIAITLPKAEYHKVERLRKQLRETRSGVILTALKHWFSCSDIRQKIVQYQQGYQSHPEDVSGMGVMEGVQASTLEPEDWS